MDAPLVRYELQDGIATLRLDDPATLNAFSTPMVEAVIAAVKRAESEARVMVITGEGRAFSSGAAAGAGSHMDKAGEMDMGSRIEAYFNPLALMLKNLKIPFVSAVNGLAVGVGSTIALSADFIVVAESAYFLQAFAKIGLVPDGGSAFILAASAGRVRAMEMMLLGEKLPAKQALEWGLVSRVVPDAEVFDTAMEFARKLAKGPASIRLIRKLAWAALEQTLEEQLLMERGAQEQAGYTPDFVEGVTAFREKRAPVFTGQGIKD